MKTKILLILFLLIPIVGFILTKASRDVSVSSLPPPLPNNISDSFLICLMDDGKDADFTYLRDSLGINLWHLYCWDDNGQNADGRHHPMGWIWGNPPIAAHDSLFTPIDLYRQDVQTQIGKNNDHQMLTLLERPKLDWLCYGQRSDYQCEDISSSDPLWFYSFNWPSHRGHDIQDSGQMVRFCRISNSTNEGNWVDNAGFVDSLLKANTEQCNAQPFLPWTADSECTWIVKPRIRIDSAFANNPTNWDKLVCRVNVTNDRNSQIMSFDIRVRNFKQHQDSVYHGNYLEEFNFGGANWPFDTSHQDRAGNWGTWFGWSARGNDPPSQYNSGTDISVYWYGNVDAWFDYVRVDNDMADGLFKHQWDSRIDSEAVEIACRTSPPFKFYIEWFEFNHIPCMSYVSNRLDSIAGISCPGSHITLMAGAYWSFSAHMPWSKRTEALAPSYIINNYLNKIEATEISGGMGGCYPFRCGYPSGCPSTDNESGPVIPRQMPIEGPHRGNTCPLNNYSRIPNTLPRITDTRIIATTDGPANYDAWLQMQLDTFCCVYQGDPCTDTCFPSQIKGGFSYSNKLFNAISRQKNTPYIAWGQLHQNVDPGGDMQREPTNEESDLIANIPITYGAKGILYWVWFSWEPPNRPCQYCLGLMGSDGLPRRYNVYNQPKWDKFKDTIFPRLRRWSPYVMSFDNQQTFSYIYRLDSERTALLNNSFFADVVTYKPGSQNPICDQEEDNPGVYPQGLIYECNKYRYLQVAKFQKSEPDGNQYFMIVNRRCSPYLNESDEDHRGGKRDVRVRFKANRSEFANFNNWKIINVEDNSTAATFDKQTSTLLDLGWFMPGEGRLYKIAPVMKEGGTLVTNEQFGNISFTCKDTVISNGKNITITGNTSTISFTDSAVIIMSNATFQSSDAQSVPTKNTFRGLSGKNWNGLSLNYSNVYIYNSKFQDIGSPSVNHAVKMLNCSVGDIRDNIFTLNSDTAGGVSANYIDDGTSGYSGLYINYNSFTMNNSRANAVQVQGFAGLTLSVYVEHNTMTSSGNATGIMLSSITGGALNYNELTKFLTGINLLYSTADLYSNTISNTQYESKGILGGGGSVLNMSGNGGVNTGGSNIVTNTSGYSKNVHVIGSLFSINNGYNSFDIMSSSPIQTYHLYGYFPAGIEYSTDAYYNCFKLDGTPIADPNLPNNYVTEGETGPQITFGFIPYSCTGGSQDGSMIADIGNGLYDTIPTNSSGIGGGFPEGVKKKDLIISPAKLLYDSLCVRMRFRHYNIVKNLCYSLINTFTDSIQALKSLRPLFLSVISTDTTSATMTALKTYFQNLILTHQNNLPLVKNCNYLVLKCKVRLRQFQSALDGFQQIVNQNPYSYEGLLARWDYMATSVLMQGYGGSFSGDDTDGDDDKSPFTKEQRKIISETITEAIEAGRTNDEGKIKLLETNADKGDVIAQKELKSMKVLKDVNKTQTPKDIFEHIQLVNNDIQKVFGIQGEGHNANQNLLPVEFALSQNYPNPFNPVTKIKYALPRDVKVVIKIYDILGREVKTLVNDFKKAGYYEEIFDGTNLATGVYFYRVEAGEFVQSKKMVLLK